MRKNFFDIFQRFIKVVYVILLLLGLVFTRLTWVYFTPQDIFSYEVICNNGKKFDPTSKPIRKPIRIIDKYELPLEFNNDEIKSECEYGTAYYVGWSSKLPKNYQLDIKRNPNILEVRGEQIGKTLISFVLYYIFLEILRRTVLYIFLGKNFFTLELIREKKGK